RQPDRHRGGDACRRAPRHPPVDRASPAARGGHRGRSTRRRAGPVPTRARDRGGRVTAGDADLVRGPGSGDGVDVVVVGAGISGLVAADAAHRAGRRVVVLEARDRVGGRLRSRSVAGGAVDLGATWFWGNDPCVWTLVERLGVGACRQYVTGDAMFEPGSRRLAGAPGVGEAARFARGAQDLATRLAAQLPPDTIRLGTRVTSVEIDDDEVR